MIQYFISEKCVGCNACFSDCPAQAIDNSQIPLKIEQKKCIRRGDCYEICPVGAVNTFFVEKNFFSK